ncbi:universal stress protein [Pseudonocardia benzenivorans]|jgi:nucleotide-binding universal stress UspA family protein|uniref:UspA domain-containing protein n=2 Tax=Pseudonocardia TaxID=1847 RepID=F4CYE0_PSEUX|nr:universal stress protein [Pseudonocardia dioxanivorans]AEA25580.1 UspA domain-containing protein [Pseudonocardia dioxanivorans CB1190]GJF04909.1 universal stress protein [Pseudonocardia sp. D17]
MPAYKTIVVGTDGSATSFAAVERAASVAADSGAKLVVVSAFTPSDPGDTAGAEDALKGEAHLVRGWTPAEEALREAADRARAAGAGEVSTHAVDGAPVEVLRAAVRDHGADLLVVGNRGLNTLSGRLLGSVPSDAARRAGVDVLIVHTT